MKNDDDAWFLPKRYGLGAGLPIAWQGWALLAAYLIIAFGASMILKRSPIAFGAVLLLATAAFLPVCAARTRGGWRWRWGED